MRHWGTCLVVLLLKLATAVLVALSASCGGSKYFTVPGPAPDVGDCSRITRTFSGKMFWSPFPFRFEGRKSMKLWASKPEGWEDFSGQIYMVSGSWNVEWVDELRMDIDPYQAVAVWNGESWYVDTRIDVAPLLQDGGDGWLFVEPSVYAKGVKPKGNPSASVAIEFAVCGPGHRGIQ